MSGRHRRPRNFHTQRRLAAGAVGAISAGSLVIPLTPSVASAAEMPDTPRTPHAPHAPRVLPDQRIQGIPDPPVDKDGHMTRGEKAVEGAREQWGRPYVYGAEGPVAFDCSGLTKYVYGQLGVHLAHHAATQYQQVQHVAKSDAQPGDLVFIYDESGIFHVGIYAGHHQMWNASRTGDVVSKDEIWTDSYVVGRP